ncbi:prokineticin-2, partial [Marmota marmota marmota]|uniref:prokineticin-2 n=1 Tax=Marmota marmota marmota TaxID=9994 RepID=UPI002092F4A2
GRAGSVARAGHLPGTPARDGLWRTGERALPSHGGHPPPPPPAAPSDLTPLPRKPALCSSVRRVCLSGRKKSLSQPSRACDKDPQCGGGMCCAVSIWVKSIRICTPMGKVGDSCHPLTRKNHFGNGRQERRERKRRRRKKEVPFFGRRMHHTCPCLPGLACVRTSFNRFTCLAHK